MEVSAVEIGVGRLSGYREHLVSRAVWPQPSRTQISIVLMRNGHLVLHKQLDDIAEYNLIAVVGVENIDEGSDLLLQIVGVHVHSLVQVDKLVN